MAWKDQLYPKEVDLSPEERNQLMLEYEEQFEGLDKESDCEVRKCWAIKCKHNSNYKCTLPEVDIDTEGRCKMYQGKGVKRHLRGD